MASPTFTVNGSAVAGAVEVTYGSTVTLALVSTYDVKSIAWGFTAISHADNPLSTITAAGSPSGATASFTFRTAPGDSAGRSYDLTCTVIDHNGVSSSMSAIVGVPGTSGVVPFCPGEETQRGASGWTTDFNLAIEGAGAGTVGLQGYLDVSRAPYLAIPNDRTKAAANTLAIQAAIDDAQTSGGVVWFPPGIWWISKSTEHAADANGITCALALGDDPITLAGAGERSSILRFCDTAGACSALVHHPETSNVLTEAYRFCCHMRGLWLDGGDLGGTLQVDYGVRSRRLVNSSFDQVKISSTASVGLALDFCFDTTVSRCDLSYNNQHALSWGVFSANQNGNQIRDCTFAWNEGFGIVAAGCVGDLIQGCIFQNNGMGGVLESSVASIKIDSCNFESNCNGAGPSANISYPDSGIHFTNDATGRYTEIFVLRGSIDTTSPRAWTYTLDITSGGDYTDTSASNTGVVITNCNVAEYTSHERFVGTNAAQNITIKNCTRLVGNQNSILAMYGDGTNGLAHRFTIENCHGFLAPELYNYALFASQNDIGASSMDGVSRRNLLSSDLLADCMARMANAAHASLTGDITISTSVTYKGRQAYRLTGEALFAGKGISIDLTAHPELASKLVYIGAMVYVPSLAAPWPTQVAAFAFYDGTTDTDPNIGQRPFVAGWQFRSAIIQLPASGTVKIGFSKLAATEAFMIDPVIAEVGAPYWEVVTESRGGYRCALNHDFTNDAHEGKVFSANGATTVAGLACYVANKDNATTLAIAGDGSGFSLVPVAATDMGSGDVSAPRIEFLLADYIPGYHPGMKVRVWVANPTNNSAAAWDAAAIALWDGGNFSAASSGGHILKRGKTATGTGFITTWLYAGTSLGSTYQSPTLAASNNTVVINADDLGHHCPQFQYGQMGSGAWPTSWTVGAGVDAGTGLTALTAANARVGLGAVRGGSGTALGIKYTHLRIDYLP